MSKESLQQYLEANPLQNLVLLKLLKQFGDAAHLEGQLSNQGTVVLLVIETALSNFFSHKYPETNVVVFPVTDTPYLLLPYLSALKDKVPLLLAISNDLVKVEAEKVFTLEFQRSNISLTISDIKNHQTDARVKMLNGIDESVRPLFFQNGYSQAELDQFQSWGGKTFMYEKDGIITSACFIFPNYPNIWEVAGVRTVDEFRGKGHARQLVQTALQYILDQGYTPRYQLESENQASLKLAQSIGMKSFLEVAHYIAW